jgi:hypothetical protein
MPIATFRGERSVDEIADTLFTDLTDRQREVAVAAILKANPQLAEINKVPNGAVLRVPRIPELRPKTDRSLEIPDARIANDVNIALQDYAKRFVVRVKDALADNESQAVLLKSAELKRALSKAPQLEQLAAQAAKAVDARNESLRDRHKDVADAIRRIREDLDAGLG